MTKEDWKPVVGKRPQEPAQVPSQEGGVTMDISDSIISDSTQVNAVDLPEPTTVTITEVSRGNSEQPVNLHLAEFSGKAFRPCKTVRRVLVQAWGKDASLYVGRRMTIYNDTRVKWGGQQVGGIRVSALSHIEKPVEVVLPESRGKMSRITVDPLTEPARTLEPTTADVAACTDVDELRAMWKASPRDSEQRALIEARIAKLNEPADDQPLIPGASS